MMHPKVFNLLVHDNARGENVLSVEVTGPHAQYVCHTVNGDKLPHMWAAGHSVDTMQIYMTVAGCVTICVTPDEHEETYTTYDESEVVTFTCQDNMHLSIRFRKSLP